MSTAQISNLRKPFKIEDSKGHSNQTGHEKILIDENLASEPFLKDLMKPPLTKQNSFSVRTVARPILSKDHEQALIEHNQNEVALEDFVGREMLRPKNMVEIRRKTAGLGNEVTVDKKPSGSAAVPPLTLNGLSVSERSAIGSRGPRNGRN